MGNMKTFWLFGFERWGGLRPAQMWTKGGRCFVPMCFGFWRRSFAGDKEAPNVKNFTPYLGKD